MVSLLCVVYLVRWLVLNPVIAVMPEPTFVRIYINAWRNCLEFSVFLILKLFSFRCFIFIFIIFRCNLERECDISADSETFGLDPCPGVPKYLEVYFGCFPGKFILFILPSFSYLDSRYIFCLFVIDIILFWFILILSFKFIGLIFVPCGMLPCAVRRVVDTELGAHI